MIEPKYQELLNQDQKGAHFWNTVLKPEILDLSKHHCRARLPFQSQLCNSLGIYHGGVIYSFGDALVGIACRTEGERSVTLSGEIHYLRNIRQGDLFAETVCVHHGRNTGVYRVLFQDEEQRLLAEATYTMYFFPEGQPGGEVVQPSALSR